MKLFIPLYEAVSQKPVTSSLLTARSYILYIITCVLSFILKQYCIDAACQDGSCKPHPETMPFNKFWLHWWLHWIFWRSHKCRRVCALLNMAFLLVSGGMTFKMDFKLKHLKTKFISEPNPNLECINDFLSEMMCRLTPDQWDSCSEYSLIASRDTDYKSVHQCTPN